MKRLLAALLLVASGILPVEASAATEQGFTVPGLKRPVQITIDKWGVPHIQAANTEDLFHAQGFMAARDRLFQIDLWRRRGLGKLSEVLGPSYVEQDRATRLFLYRGDMQVEWASYGPEAKAAATRFTDGVNAYVDWLAANPASLPVEFRELGYQPARWQPEDVVRIRSHGLALNFVSEIMRAKVACVTDVNADKVRIAPQPDKNLVVPQGLDPCTVTDDVMRTFLLAIQDVTFKQGTVQVVPPGDASEGSNNWVVSPSRTTTGRPILANDPHRALKSPSLRYITHLSAPGLNVIGAGEPFQPGISIGHNGTVAFGLTIFGIDQEDLYVYQLDPADHTRYRYRDGWESIRTVTETVPVAGQQAQTVELSFTRHGPVLKVDHQRGLAFALRTGWAEPGMSPYFGNLKLMRARNFDDFRSAMRNWGAPAENQVYADTSGKIAWVPGGLVPRRSGYDGLMPVPGDGRYEWNGFITGDQLPYSVDPAQGFLASANQYNLPPGAPVVGHEWANPARYQRIVDVLSKTPRGSVASSVALQNDQFEQPAARLIPLLGSLSSTDPGVQAALTLLRGWNKVSDAGSGPAALYHVWVSRHLLPAYAKAVLPQAAQPIIPAADLEVALDGLERKLDPSARDALLLTTLGAAYQETQRLLGTDSAQWRWGTLHQATFTHPLGKNVGPFARGGSANTVDAAGFGASFGQTSGASFRMVLDVGGWDNSQAVNTPGQSGDPASPHYRDLADKWYAGQTFPLLYSKAAINRNAEQRITLNPA